ncbi:HSF-type DNA-binding domain-containing protein [Ditylenchus destructor]|uniref:HSF-type DNA-binding domain-containing protein n=1 Tax=Ditylenchus destructor TaxID=166010 RepID=A0AAD4N2U1_9BILA|nr:HSF-type DNA-binding domain-containing protein [Ditylenchus destructor]
MSGFMNRSQQPQNQPVQRRITLETDGGLTEDDQLEDYKMHQRALQPQHTPQQQLQPYLLKEDEKIPLFLIKLWNIVEDPAYFDVIRWDESGYSFHITDPYSFCRNVLPQYFKHNNLNSLIRQLNMYGFRKMTPIERTSLARAESDQDHLEFSHPYFVRDHPELLMNIKRKVSLAKQAHDTSTTATTVNVPVKDLSSVFDELRQLRDRQKTMEMKMNGLVKDNELIWRELDHVRGAHVKQQQIVNKLVQFLVALVQPNKQQRLGKRHLLAIDDFQAKRLRAERGMGSGNADDAYGTSNSSLQTMQSNNANEVLDSLLQELASGGLFNNLPLIMRSTRSGSSASSSNGPIIAEVTDELDQLSTENLQQQSGTQPMAYAHEVQVTEPTSFNDYMGTAYTATGVRNVPSPRQRRQPSGKGSRQPQQAQQQFVYSAQQASRKSSHQPQPNMTQPHPGVMMVSNHPPSSTTPYVPAPVTPTQQTHIVRQIRQPPAQHAQYCPVTMPIQPAVSMSSHNSGGMIPTTLPMPTVQPTIPQTLFPTQQSQMTLPNQTLQTSMAQVPSFIQYNSQQPTHTQQAIVGQASKEPCSPPINTSNSPIIVQPGSNESDNQISHLAGPLGLARDEQSLNTPVTSNAPEDTGLQLSDFEDYISNVNDSIKNVHGALGSHWDDHLLDNLLEEYDDNDDHYSYTGQGGRGIDLGNGLEAMIEDSQNGGGQSQVNSLLNVPTVTPTKSPNNGRTV